MLKNIIVPTLLYGSESWLLSTIERRRVKVYNIKCLRKMLWLGLMQRISNKSIKRNEITSLSWKGESKQLQGGLVMYAAKVDAVRRRSRQRRKSR